MLYPGSVVPLAMFNFYSAHWEFRLMLIDDSDTRAIDISASALSKPVPPIVFGFFNILAALALKAIIVVGKPQSHILRDLRYP